MELKSNRITNPKWFIKSLWNSITDRDFILWLVWQTKLNIEWVFNKPKDNFDHWNNTPSIMLVPWFTCNSWVMSQLWGILNDKYNVFYAPEFLILNTWDIQVSATILSNKIVETLRNFEKNWDLYIIWHSMWWLIAIESMQNWKFKINKLITWATPYLGTPLWKPLTFLKSIKQIQEFKNSIFTKLTAISPLINELQQHISVNDNFVPPENQSTKNILIPISLHNKTKIIEHPFIHTDFIAWKKVKEFAESI